MNKEEAIKYLQQLYPNGGRCWLDEQRIEAIGMAVKALQEESKFKVGQYLKQGDTIVKILEVSDDGYHCDSAFIPFSAQDQWELVKEPVSEDLEKAANEWDVKASFTPFYMTLDDNNSPNGVRRDYTTHAESFKAGAKWQKDRMMLNTIDATCFGFQGAALFSFRLPAGSYLVGSKVKVVVIKED